jgi:hypothetical protein
VKDGIEVQAAILLGKKYRQEITLPLLDFATKINFSLVIVLGREKTRA